MGVAVSVELVGVAIRTSHQRIARGTKPLTTASEAAGQAAHLADSQLIGGHLLERREDLGVMAQEIFGGGIHKPDSL